MLVLTRKLHERVYIGDDISVSIAKIGTSEVRLAIEAPRHVAIERQELRDAGPYPKRSILQWPSAFGVGGNMVSLCGRYRIDAFPTGYQVASVSHQSPLITCLEQVKGYAEGMEKMRLAASQVVDWTPALTNLFNQMGVVNGKPTGI